MDKDYYTDYATIVRDIDERVNTWLDIYERTVSESLDRLEELIND